MLKGLDGRRIALTSPDDASSETLAAVAEALVQAGAAVEVLTDASAAENWHGGRYAALVLVGDPGRSGLPTPEARLVQLVREFLVSEKPVAAWGGGVGVLVEAGGAAGRTLTAAGNLKAAAETAGGKVVNDPVHVDGALITAQGRDIAAFTQAVVREFSRGLEEREVDEMSAQSFPASDPPATNPAVGAAGEADTRG